MSDNKIYYWLKLKDNFFDKREMNVIRKKENGAEYIIIWQKILLQAITQQEPGLLYFRDRIPYTPELLAETLNEDVDHVKGALTILTKYNMIEIQEDGAYWVEEACLMIGKETDRAAKMRKIRFDRKNVTLLQDVTKCAPELELKKEKDIEIKIEKEKKETLSPDSNQLSQLLYDKIMAEGNGPTKYKNKPPNLKLWSKDIYKLLTTDGVKPELVRKVILFATSDKFWKSNILSGGKLRDKFTTLEMQAKKIPVIDIEASAARIEELKKAPKVFI